ncbi:MAG: cation transporter [Thermodesulfobacteriota bacterium]
MLREEPHHHGHDHDPDHDQDHHDHDDEMHRDQNLRSAYVHVLADALTSVFAITALLCGRLLGWAFLDPVMGLAGAFVICIWAWGLCRSTARVLLDMDTDGGLSARIRGVLEQGSAARVTDLHVWRVAPGRFSAVISLTPGPGGENRPEAYKKTLAPFSELAHVTVEINPEEGDNPS